MSKSQNKKNRKAWERHPVEIKDRMRVIKFATKKTPQIIDEVLSPGRGIVSGDIVAVGSGKDRVLVRAKYKDEEDSR